MRRRCGCFRAVLAILDAIAGTSSMKQKQAIIQANAEDDFFGMVVTLALDPYLRFKLTGNIRPLPNLVECQDDYSQASAIFKYLRVLSTKKAADNRDRDKLSILVQHAGSSAVQVINRILNKDLRCGASVQTFRASHHRFESLPVHHPMKGIDDLEKFYKHAKNRENICWSYKLDGTRIWALVSHDSVLYLSSNGHELDNFHVFDEALLNAAKLIYPLWDCHTVVFDGEVVNIQGDFSRHMSQFRRLKDMDASGFRFRIFDLLPKQGCTLPFRARYTALCQQTGLPMWHPDGRATFLCSILRHSDLVASPKKLARHATELGLEGLMLKTWDHVYQTKRSNDWCKIKFFQTEDLPVVDKIEGTGKHVGRLGALVVQRGEVRVEVGSGFTDAEREEFWANPPRCIEVKYQDALASGSLRFPIFVRVRDDKDM